MQEFSKFRSLSVIGGGAWGTALANLAAHNGTDVLIWAREPEVTDSINNRHENEAFLRGVNLHPGLQSTSDLTIAAKRDAFLFVVPAQFGRATLSELNSLCGAAPVALCSKGIERATGLMMTEVLSDTWPGAIPAVLSGPSFARDVARGLPTAVTFACPDAAIGGKWIATLGAPHFRLYLSDDLVGAELGGAVKNVLAIAAGAVEGRGLGESARAALIARGFIEFQRLGVARGAKPQTMAGLSGLGDLILTASSQQSRNMSLGFELGRGRSLEDILGERRTVSEGVASASAIATLAAKAGVEMPICAAVSALVDGQKSIDEIIADLLARPLKQENE